MRKLVMIAVALIVSFTALAQQNAAKKKGERPVRPAKHDTTKATPVPKVDTAKIKDLLLSDQGISALADVITITNKGLPSSQTVSAGDASATLNTLELLRQKLSVLYTERHKPKPVKEDK